MNRYNFLPLNYRRKLRGRQKKRFAISIYVFVTIISLLTIIMFINLKNVNNLDRELKIYSEKQSSKDKNIKKLKKDISIKTLQKIIPYINDSPNFKLDSITIDKNLVSMKICTSNKERINEFINDIEAAKIFKITNLKVAKQENKINIDISLEG